MVCHCGFHNVSRGYLALECVVLLGSHTSTARSVVLVPALWILSSWIPPRPRMCASTPLAPPALIFKRYNTKWNYIHMRKVWGFGGGGILSRTVSLETHLMVSDHEPFLKQWVNFPKHAVFPFYFQKHICIPSAPLWCDGVDIVSSAMEALHKTNELAPVHMFERRKPGLFTTYMTLRNGFYVSEHWL